jgi:hypothetical protein
MELGNTFRWLTRSVRVKHEGDDSEQGAKRTGKGWAREGGSASPNKVHEQAMHKAITKQNWKKSAVHHPPGMVPYTGSRAGAVDACAAGLDVGVASSVAVVGSAMPGGSEGGTAAVADGSAS